MTWQQGDGFRWIEFSVDGEVGGVVGFRSYIVDGFSVVGHVRIDYFAAGAEVVHGASGFDDNSGVSRTDAIRNLASALNHAAAAADEWNAKLATQLGKIDLAEGEVRPLADDTMSGTQSTGGPVWDDCPIAADVEKNGIGGQSE